MDMKLEHFFDAVVMLTWSDWKTEPRSNRYHYATRFARTLPVLFLQHRYSKRECVAIEPSEIDGIDIVHVSIGLNASEISEIRQLLHARGIRRPLVWIYDSMNYQPLLDALPMAFRVYHATEDYLTRSESWGDGWSLGRMQVAESVVRMLDQVDFMVACTEGVAASCVGLGNYRGRYAVIENGCDAEFFLEHAAQYDADRAAGKPPVAVFQGGINSRVDFVFLHDLIQRMPTWEFWFCGVAVDSEGWSRVTGLSNVRYFGPLPPEKFAQLMCESTVGIITYKQDDWIRNSLPLKAYEYVACGLPVVSVPIAALEREPSLMTIASTVDEFETALRTVTKTRFDPALLRQRRAAALAKSYNLRFQSMAEQLLAARSAGPATRPALKIAMLFDSIGSMHVSTIQQHLAAFQKYSRHDVTFVPATELFWNLAPERVAGLVDFDYFDVVVVHYSVRLSVKTHLEEGLARALERFRGFKVMYIQDEYEGTEIARLWMDRLQFDLVYTCVPETGREFVYPSYRFPATEFLPTLTGYVPEDPGIEDHAQPLAERRLLIVYRGRRLPSVYGRLGYEKFQIGVEMKRIAAECGVAVDIEVDDARRIYGAGWYQFLGSARATLGTESGANVFDVDGSLKAAIADLEARKPGIAFEKVAAKILAPHEGRVQMNQISPKVFEAIRLRTALVLFEGSYSGVVQPDVHFIPLKKDFSNARDVIEKLQDTEYVQQLTDRAYADIVASGRYSYRRFIEAFDADIDSRLIRGNGCMPLMAPLLFRDKSGNPRQALPAMDVPIDADNAARPKTLADFDGVSVNGPPSVALTVNARLGEPTVAAHGAGAAQGAGAPVRSSTTGTAAVAPSWAYRTLHAVWHRLPFGPRVRLVRQVRSLVGMSRSPGSPRTMLFRVARRGWRLLPFGVRNRLVRIIERS